MWSNRSENIFTEFFSFSLLHFYLKTILEYNLRVSFLNRYYFWSLFSIVFFRIDFRFDKKSAIIIISDNNSHNNSCEGLSSLSNAMDICVMFVPGLNHPLPEPYSSCIAVALNSTSTNLMSVTQTRPYTRG